MQALVVGGSPFNWPDTCAESFVAAHEEEIRAFELKQERAALEPLHEAFQKTPELLDFGADNILANLPHYATLFVDARAHERLAQRADAGEDAEEPLPARLNVVVVRNANDLDDFDGIVAIRHM